MQTASSKVWTLVSMSIFYNHYSMSALCVYIYIYIYIYIVKLVVVVEGDLMAPFSIATTTRCREGRYSFPWIAPLYLYTYLIMLSVKRGGIKYHFLSLWYDSTWNWTLVSWTIGKHSNHHANVHKYIYIYIYTLSAEFRIYWLYPCQRGKTLPKIKFAWFSGIIQTLTIAHVGLLGQQWNFLNEGIS